MKHADYLRTLIGRRGELTFVSGIGFMVYAAGKDRSRLLEVHDDYVLVGEQWMGGATAVEAVPMSLFVVQES